MKRILLFFIVCTLLFTSTGFADISPEEAKKYIGKTVIVNTPLGYESGRKTFVGIVIQVFTSQLNQRKEPKTYLSLLLGIETKFPGFPARYDLSGSHYYQQVYQINLKNVIDIKEFNDVVK